ncbi:hypothetical protein [Aureivirga sp. CE67]|uniref:hypothetical protein n=1 Tax=Aureivirga sp. CE67 TaxID=1788983 RepID=UPI0018C9B913|nr:hypothetical protein [Aureivirga sp. CE67]
MNKLIKEYKNEVISLTVVLGLFLFAYKLYRDYPFNFVKTKETEATIIESRKDWAINSWGTSKTVWWYTINFNINGIKYKGSYLKGIENRRLKNGTKLLLKYSESNPKNYVILSVKEE